MLYVKNMFLYFYLIVIFCSKNPVQIKNLRRPDKKNIFQFKYTNLFTFSTVRERLYVYLRNKNNLILYNIPIPIFTPHSLRQ